jgi:hypothetical protein
MYKKFTIAIDPLGERCVHALTEKDAKVILWRSLSDDEQNRVSSMEVVEVEGGLANEEFFAEHCEHISINKWLVQLVSKGVWYTAYFKAPDAMKPPPAVLYASKTEALAAVFAAARKGLS